jgi:hypothetical protein
VAGSYCILISKDNVTVNKTFIKLWFWICIEVWGALSIYNKL